MDEQILNTIRDEIVNRLKVLREAWDIYPLEPFMRGKVEAADVATGLVNRVFNKFLATEVNRIEVEDE